MKWKNKGHEFDAVYEKMNDYNKFYLFGAGDYGKLFNSLVKDEINIVGFIDNNSKRHGEIYEGKEVVSYDNAILDDETAIIVTASQFSRISILEQLDCLGVLKNEKYFILEVFLSVYFAYKYNKVYFTNISTLPSTKCNLNCECCLNFNPYAKAPDIRPIEQVKEDIDLFFNAVDKVMLYHFSGGETFLYKDCTEVIKYLCDNYRDKIGSLRMITNGTIVPKDEVLEELSKYDFEIVVDDYIDTLPKFKNNFDKLLAKLEKFNIKYFTNKDDEWIDLAPTTTDNSNFKEEELINHFDTCSQAWQELREGKLYSCNYDGYATAAGINPMQDEEVYHLKTYKIENIKSLIEFRLGFNAKGYTNLCTHCKGFRPENDVIMIPAKQL